MFNIRTSAHVGRFCIHHSGVAPNKSGCARLNGMAAKATKHASNWQKKHVVLIRLQMVKSELLMVKPCWNMLKRWMNTWYSCLNRLMLFFFQNGRHTHSIYYLSCLSLKFKLFIIINQSLTSTQYLAASSFRLDTSPSVNFVWTIPSLADLRMLLLKWWATWEGFPWNKPWFQWGH